MSSLAPRPLSLALLRSARAAANGLRAALERRGVQVVVDERISSFSSRLGWNHCLVDALLIDLEAADDAEFALLDGLLERVVMPIVFHDGHVRVHDEFWLRHLLDKITAGVAAQPAVAVARPTDTALRCWVLGASFGGPEALQRFLDAMPAVPANTTFIIGQHIGDGFVDVMAAQLNRRTAFEVMPASDGALLQSGRIYIAPVLERLRIDSTGHIRLQQSSERPTYLPSIDRLMEEVAQHFGRYSGAIVFSGMGDDGAKGSVAIHRAGGMVWAQSADSCACDSMPNCARATGAVSREGTPEELAASLADYLAATAAVASVRMA